MDPDVDLLVAFANARSETGDELASPERFQRWLSARHLIPDTAAVSPEESRRATHLRAAIVSLLHEAHGMPEDPRTRPAIEEITRRAPFRLAVAGRELVAEPEGTPADRALAELVAALYRVQLRGRLDRVKACKSCGHAFFDTSKNRSRIWCDMGTCGSQEKARAYRQRRRKEAATQ